MPIRHEDEDRTIQRYGLFLLWPDPGRWELRDRLQGAIFLMQGKIPQNELENVVSLALDAGPNASSHSLETSRGKVIVDVFLPNFPRAEYRSGRAELQTGLRITAIPEFAEADLDKEDTWHLNALSLYDFTLIKFMLTKQASKDERKWNTVKLNEQVKQDRWQRMRAYGNPLWVNMIAKYMWPADAAELAATSKSRVQTIMPMIRGQAVHAARKMLTRHGKGDTSFKSLVTSIWVQIHDPPSFNQAIKLAHQDLMKTMKANLLELFSSTKQGPHRNWVRLMVEIGKGRFATTPGTPPQRIIDEESQQMGMARAYYDEQRAFASNWAVYIKAANTSQYETQ
jgi:hypothetical protein